MNWTRRDSDPFDPSDIDEFTKWLDTVWPDDFTPRPSPPTIVSVADGRGMSRSAIRFYLDRLDD